MLLHNRKNYTFTEDKGIIMNRLLKTTDVCISRNYMIKELTHYRVLVDLIPCGFTRRMLVQIS